LTEDDDSWGQNCSIPTFTVGLKDLAEVRVDLTALAAITLMTAMSRPDEKETIVQLVTNMLNVAA